MHSGDGRTGADEGGWRRRVRLERELARHRFAEAATEQLATIAIDDSHPDREVAMAVLFRRLEPMLRSRARAICSHLSHCGRNCSPAGACTEAFGATMRSIVKRVFGIDAVVIGGGSASTLVPAARRRAARTATPNCTLRRWNTSPRRASVQIAGFTAKELGGTGVTSDARREWNAERGLPVRLNLNDTDRALLIGAVRALLEAEPWMSTTLVHLTEDSDILRWTEWLYDDACDNAPASIDGVHQRRVAHRSGLLDSIDEELPDTARRALELAAQAVIDLPDHVLFAKYLAPAWHHTRGMCP